MCRTRSSASPTPSGSRRPPPGGGCGGWATGRWAGTARAPTVRPRSARRAAAPRSLRRRSWTRSSGWQVRRQQAQVRRAEAVHPRVGLVPVRVEQRHPAGLLEPAQLVRREREIGSGQVVAELVLGPRADDDRRDALLGECVRERDLGGGDVVRRTDLDEGVDRVVQAVLVVDRRLRPALEPAGALRRLLAAAVLAGEQAAGERAPDEHAEALLDRDRDELVLGVPGLQRVVDLLADERLQAVAVRD